jgi:acetamidase/formamidase
VVTPGVVVYGAYTATTRSHGDDESAVELIRRRTASSVSTTDDAPDAAVIGCLAVAPAEGGAREAAGPLRREHGLRELRAGATLILPVAHDGGGLYFGDCKALMGDGEIVGPPEVGALVTASAEPCARPASLEWPRLVTSDTMTTLVSGTPLEWSARQAFRELLNWVTEDFTLPRAQAALLLAMVAQAGI